MPAWHKVLMLRRRTVCVLEGAARANGPYRLATEVGIQGPWSRTRYCARGWLSADRAGRDYRRGYAPAAHRPHGACALWDAAQLLQSVRCDVLNPAQFDANSTAAPNVEAPPGCFYADAAHGW